MADAQVSEIFADVAGLFGEDPNSPEVYTPSMLYQHYGVAYRELYGVLMNLNLQISDQEGIVVLPAYSKSLRPSQMGITDFGEPQKLWERGSAFTKTILSISNTTPAVVTTDGAHGLATNQEVGIYGVANTVGINDQWFITSLGSDTFSLNNSVAGGPGTGGTVSWSSENWYPMRLADVLPQWPIGQRLTYWEWKGDALRFLGANEVRQLKLEYSASGNPPSSGAVGIDNARDFLVYRTASLAGRTRDEERAAQFAFESLGKNLAADGSGGLLRTLVNPMLKQKQRIPHRRMPFRPRRHALVMRPFS